MATLKIEDFKDCRQKSSRGEYGPTHRKINFRRNMNPPRHEEGHQIKRIKGRVKTRSTFSVITVTTDKWGYYVSDCWFSKGRGETKNNDDEAKVAQHDSHDAPMVLIVAFF